MNRRQFLTRSLQLSVAVAVTTGLIPAASAAVSAAPRRRSKPARGPLRVCPANPRYFTDGSGRALYLTGAHTWPNVVDIGPSDPPPRFDFDGFLDFQQRHGHNFIRLWTWECIQWNTAGNDQKQLHTAYPHPWARTGGGQAVDGKPRFDLTQFDPEYFQRLRTRVKAARDRGIYTSVMLFEGWAMQHAPGAWAHHPFHPRNHVNGLTVDADGDGNGLELYTLKNPAVTIVQETYVRHVIETVNGFDNVLYEISNENHPGSTEWQYHFIRFLKDREANLRRQHPVGMTFQYQGGKNQALFDSPADWISPNPDGGYRDNPPVADGRKVILNDTDHLWGLGGDVAWVWKSFLRGLNVLFMDPYDRTVLKQEPESKWEAIRRNLGYTRRYAERVNLTAMTPEPDLASSGWCLAHAAEKQAEYLVFAPKPGRVTVNLAATRLRLKVEWFNPATGETTPGQAIEGGGSVELAAPFAGDAVLYLRGK